MHKARLTTKITLRRCQYLEHQWNRGRLCNVKDIVPKIKTNLPARENEVLPLKNKFIDYMRNERDVIVCERCGLLTSCWDYIGEEQVCMNCYEDGQNE